MATYYFDYFGAAANHSPGASQNYYQEAALTNFVFQTLAIGNHNNDNLSPSIRTYFTIQSGSVTDGNTYYHYWLPPPSVHTIIVGSGDNATFKITNLDDNSITGIGNYVYGDGTNCWYETTSGADTYTPSKTGYSFSPSSVALSSGIAVFESFSASESGVATKPTNPTPTNNDTEVDFSGLQLSWDDGGGADTFDVYIGASSSLTKVSDAQAGTTYTTTLAEIQSIYGAAPINQKIYWRVDATNDEGTTTGDEWNFDARPGAVTDTTPADEATGIALHSTTGSWTAATNADSYDSYFGTLSGFTEFVENTEEISSTLTEENFDQYGDIYYWKVKARNDFGITDSDEFWFTTIKFLPPSPTYWDANNGIWYRALTETGIDGDEGTDWEEAYNPNFINTSKRLVVAAKNCIFYESL